MYSRLGIFISAIALVGLMGCEKPLPKTDAEIVQDLIAEDPSLARDPLRLQRELEARSVKVTVEQVELSN